MTLMELFGCALVSFSPALMMFIFTVAKNPLKIILLTCSSFFWLLSLLLSAVVWYAVVPLRQHLVFGMIVSVIFQEAIRVGLYFLLKRAESGLQKIALAEEEPGSGAAEGGDEIIGDPHATNNDATERSVSAAPDSTMGIAVASSVGAPAGAGAPPVSTDRVSLTSASRSARILNLRSLSYVCGLGFGFMSGAFSMVNLLADVSGPGTVGLASEHEAFLLVSSSLALLFICLNVCWTVVTFVCLEDNKRYLLAPVWISHMLCSLLTLLNGSSFSPLMALVPTLTSLVCLLACLLLSLHLLRANMAGFMLSLVSPMWLCDWLRRAR